MVVRKFPRFPVTMPSTLVQRDRLRYKGAVKDLSRKGCRVESVIRPFTGMQLELHLQPPGETPLMISNAAVRWTGLSGIGVEFLTIAASEQERLDRILKQLSAQTNV
jgi:PilZ domain